MTTATMTPRMTTAASVLPAQVGYTTRFFADQITVKHAGETLDVWQATVLSGCEPPGHVHDRHDEWLQVLEGCVRAWVGEDEYELTAGDLLHLPKGVPHRYEVQGREATIQVVTSPGGFVEVFTELNRRFGRGGMPVVMAPNHLEVSSPRSRSTASGSSPRSVRRHDARHMTQPPLRLVLVLSENWTLTSRPATCAAWCRSRSRRRRRASTRDGLRARRHGAVVGRGGRHDEPARLRPAGQPGAGHAVAGLDGAASRDRRGHDAPAARARAPSSRRCAIRCCWPSSSRRSTCCPRGGSWCCRRSAGTATSTRRWACPSTAAARCSTSTWRPGGRAGATSPATLRGRALRVPRRLRGAEAVPRPRGRRCGSAAARSTTACCAASWSTGTASTRSASRPPEELQRLDDGDARRRAATRPTWSGSAASAAASPGTDDLADVDEALEAVPAQVARGFRSICFKPSMFTNDPADVGRLCRHVVERANALAG